ncbi:hypothetical protein [Haladaptatus sp. CMSO5]|uniref:hypothetical protein n=1 Tax=Haladaptatus sp. CMSO5 TaxID=3120514 RepID=UPI002FCE00E2
MTASQPIELLPEQNAVTIQDLTINDSDIVDYLSDFPTTERSHALQRAIKIGVSTLELSETSKDVEFVKREFSLLQDSFQSEIDEMRAELETRFGDGGELSEAFDEYLGNDGTLQSQMIDAFGEGGEFEKRLDAVLGEDGEMIQQALDPDKQGTPTNRLEVRMKEEFRSIHDKLEEKEVKKEMKRRSWEKGDEFEEIVGELLGEIVYGTNDIHEPTGDKEGEIPGRDVGDHVITLGETGQRVVLEAKSEKGYSQNKIKQEMEEALENRAADYGIFITECESYVPNKIGYFQEFDQKILSVALRADEDDEIEPGFLQIAYNWARMRTLQNHLSESDSIDTAVVNAQVDEVRDSIKRFSTVKTKCTRIEDTAQEIKGLLDEIQQSVNEKLNRVTAELSKVPE